MTFRRTPTIQIGGYRQGPFPEDYDLWLRLHQAGTPGWRNCPINCSTGAKAQAEYRVPTHAAAGKPSTLCARAIWRKSHDCWNAAMIWLSGGLGAKTRKRCRYLLDYGFKVNAWIDIDPRKIGNPDRQRTSWLTQSG